MYTSFYTAARGAMEEQKKFDVIANNFANVNIKVSRIFGSDVL